MTKGKTTIETAAERRRLRKRYQELHEGLDLLVAAYCKQTGERPSKTTVLQLMKWSARQTMEPTL